MKRTPVAGPWITDKEVAYAADAARTAWYDGANRYVEDFERAFAEYLGVRHAVSLPSCTSGLHLALAALEVGPGHEVVVPDVTWIATAAPISYVGAEPVFADVDPESWCLDPDSLAEWLTPRTRAIIAVDLYGGMPDYERLRRVAREAGVPLIEDAAEAVGSEYGAKMAGSLGLAGAFSFHGSKTLTTGEGGMLVTDSDEIHRKALVLRDHGRAPGDVAFFNRQVAFKYKMSATQAAIGLAQTERVRELVGKKREIFGWYREELGGIPGLTLNAEPEGTVNSYWMTTVLFDPGLGLDKEAAAIFLRERGIDTRPFFHPLSSLPAYQGLKQSESAQKRNKTSYSISRRGINLPSPLNLTRQEAARVGEAVRALVSDPTQGSRP